MVRSEDTRRQDGGGLCCIGDPRWSWGFYNTIYKFENLGRWAKFSRFMKHDLSD